HEGKHQDEDDKDRTLQGQPPFFLMAPLAGPRRRTEQEPRPRPELVTMPTLLHDASMIRFEDILDKVESYKPDFDEELLQRAYIFSAREHRGQVRSSGDPYLIHPLNV